MLKGGRPCQKVAWVLMLVGGLNWGLIGLFDYNLVHAIFGGVPVLERILYILVGVAAIIMIGSCKSHCQMGKKKK